MKHWYDQNATLVEFQPGQKVWVMAPVDPRALQDKWTGPFEVVERKNDVAYLVKLRTPRNPLRVLHKNQLKPHFEKIEVTMLLAKDDGVEEEHEPLHLTDPSSTEGLSPSVGTVCLILDAKGHSFVYT
ncbi:hypothetical protein NDU88_006056 [Pleurodeles waltl]|uniref:Uncharacterized protein n=1 Tax=Pleurodeles waltl TaxID=8319 RepID=A0AAV7VPF7_PLEWA|nr:hypothetical protein NDU88_006056 [Pleurodeles waltl]